MVIDCVCEWGEQTMFENLAPLSFIIIVSLMMNDWRLSISARLWCQLAIQVLCVVYRHKALWNKLMNVNSNLDLLQKCQIAQIFLDLLQKRQIAQILNRKFSNCVFELLILDWSTFKNKKADKWNIITETVYLVHSYFFVISFIVIYATHFLLVPSLPCLA
jgi:hypothetical protein